jgi:hypothetical protein
MPGQLGRTTRETILSPASSRAHSARHYEGGDHGQLAMHFEQQQGRDHEEQQQQQQQQQQPEDYSPLVHGRTGWRVRHWVAGKAGPSCLQLLLLPARGTRTPGVRQPHTQGSLSLRLARRRRLGQTAGPRLRAAQPTAWTARAGPGPRRGRAPPSMAAP